MESKTAHGLKVISKTNAAETSRHPVPPTLGLQQALFPLRSSRSLIFVSLPDVDHQDFVSLLQSTAPAVVIEMRRIPRFDIGPLNRQGIFELFRKLEDLYLDLGTEWFDKSDGHNLPPMVQNVLQANIRQQRPILFLTSEKQTLPSFSKSIMEWLTKSGEPWEIYEVPQHNTKLTEFIA